jgi:hypothetical protein
MSPEPGRHILKNVAHVIGTLLVGVGALSLAVAQDGMPRRKSGLWEVAMEMPGRTGATMKSQHCVDERSDEQVQRRALDDAPDARCEQRNVKRSAGGYEADYSCKSARGKTEGHMSLAGDFTNRYTMQNQMRFDPPRGGVSETKVTLQGQWIGACPPDMKPGQMRITGMPSGTAARGERAGRERKPPTPEQMQKMQEMMEQMRQQRGSK